MTFWDSPEARELNGLRCENLGKLGRVDQGRERDSHRFLDRLELVKSMSRGIFCYLVWWNHNYGWELRVIVPLSPKRVVQATSNGIGLSVSRLRCCYAIFAIIPK